MMLVFFGFIKLTGLAPVCEKAINHVMADADQKFYRQLSTIMGYTVQKIGRRSVTMAQDVWHVWPDRGFLMSPDPLHHLSEADHNLPAPLVDQLESTAAALPQLLRTAQLRPALEALPPVDYAELLAEGVDSRVGERLILLYSYFASAYVHAPEGESRLPPGVAVPLSQIARIVERPPILSYATLVLGNWRRTDPAGGFDLDNLDTLQTFTGLADESGFMLVHIAVEAAGASILQTMRAAFDAVPRDDSAAVLEALREINRQIVAITQIFHHMPERCDMDVYHRDIRPYLFGFDGVVFDGVTHYGGKPQTLRGGSGAQSSLIPALNAALGIRHARSELTVHLDALRAYIPCSHRAFIDGIDLTLIRDYVRVRPPLADAYNACVHRLVTFRRAHLYYARTYIFEKSTNPVGTAGTQFMDFLGKLVEETQAHLL